MIIYKWVFAHAISMSALCDFFFNRKKKKEEEDSEKKVFIYALHFFVSLTFCTYLKRLTSVSGLTEPFSRSAKILYSMYMYFYSYAYKYMSVICLLCPVFLCFLTCLKAARATMQSPIGISHTKTVLRLAFACSQCCLKKTTPTWFFFFLI